MNFLCYKETRSRPAE